jgi:hypothetical protein
VRRAQAAVAAMQAAARLAAVNRTRRSVVMGAVAGLVGAAVVARWAGQSVSGRQRQREVARTEVERARQHSLPGVTTGPTTSSKDAGPDGSR